MASKIRFLTRLVPGRVSRRDQLAFGESREVQRHEQRCTCTASICTLLLERGVRDWVQLREHICPWPRERRATSDIGLEHVKIARNKITLGACDRSHPLNDSVSHCDGSETTFKYADIYAYKDLQSQNTGLHPCFEICSDLLQVWSRRCLMQKQLKNLALLHTFFTSTKF